MIKRINHQNFLTTPFVTTRRWDLFNIENDEVVLLEATSSEQMVALEYVDYSTDNPFVNTTCNIALEQQSDDLVNYQEGITGSGAFYPDREETNQDGTYKRLVHRQIKAAFYNKYGDPTKMFGMDFIDFPLSQTFRNISNFVRVFDIPRYVFGERIIENTVVLRDASLDDNVTITDDGHQNLIAKSNLFSKVQEVRSFENIIMSGSSSHECYNDHVDVNVIDYPRLSIGFSQGALEDVPITEYTNTGIAFNSGALTLGVITSSNFDSSSNSVAFVSGYITDDTLTASFSDSGSYGVSFLIGSMSLEVVTGSAYLTGSAATTSSMGLAFTTGSLFTEVLVPSGLINSASYSIGFLSGSLT